MFKTATKVIGQTKINNALAAFEQIQSDLEDGITHLESHVSTQRAIITDSEEAIDEALSHIDRATRVSKRIKEITN